jgi:hypothetical protein
MSLSSAAVLAFGQASSGLDVAASNLARASDPDAAVDPVADHVTLTKAAMEMAVAAKLLHVQKETQQALIDVMA